MEWKLLHETKRQGMTFCTIGHEKTLCRETHVLVHTSGCRCSAERERESFDF